MLSEEQQKLAEDNIKLVFYVINKYEFMSHDEVDLGYIGLCEAALTYNRSYGVKFSTYAIRCIFNEILSYITRKKNIYKSRTIPISATEQQIEDNRETDILDVTPAELSLYDTPTYRQFLSNFNEFANTLKPMHFDCFMLPLSGRTQSDLAKVYNKSQAQISRAAKTLRKQFIAKYYHNTTLNELLNDIKEESYGKRYRG